ncbi:MAG: DEAD/DEAH box helicase [Rhodococcus sp. (in: high G+C Gram-positive bacteria)]
MRARREDTRKAETLSKITVDHENDSVAETTVSATLDTTHTPPTFAELGVHPEIVRGLSDIGIERTFAIQELTLPLALAGDDLIGQARTGMGKTYGFGVPLLHRLATGPADGSGTTTLDGTPRALIIVPTRELCVQVTSDLENASKHLHSSNGRVKVMSIYGGRPYEAQIETLRTGVDVVVGTPGRLLDLAKQGHLVLGKVGVLVLDEADEMLDLGFLPDIERLMGMVPDKRQTMLFSATMPGPIITLARTFLTQPTHIRAEEAESSAIHERTAQHVFRAHALDKAEMVARVLQADGRGATMIFTRTKRTAQKVADDLAERGFAVGAVHGDLGQVAREKSLNAFRNGKIDVLVATDVAARGIDIDDVTHVINYQCPEDEKTYVHRIGRTGRAGRTGIAVTLVDWDDIPRWQLIDKALGLDIPDPVETYSSSDHLYSELDIPRGTTGSIAKPKSSKPARSAQTGSDQSAGSGRAADSDQDGAKRDGDEAPRSTPRRNRSRRRTRGGNSDAGTSTPDTSGSEVTGSDTKGSDTKGSDDSPSERPRRRRRRRPSAGSAAHAGDSTPAPQASSPAGSSAGD